MNITDLGGHSGCQILLCEKEDDLIWVRKVAGNKEYNQRLIKQAEKQAHFVNSVLKAPKVINEGYTDEGLFFFDMEYIQGITMAEYIKSIEIGKVRSICETIVDNLVFASDGAGRNNEEIFAEKIDSLQNTLKNSNNSVIDQALLVLKSHNWNRFVSSYCHGDLTLENIIIKDNQIYLIDFLDSFYDSWIFDIGTIMQDVQTMWSYRHEKEVDINTKLRLLVFRDILLDSVKKVSQEDYVEIYYALLLKLLRIFPYTKDKETYDFLIEKVMSILTIIREI